METSNRFFQKNSKTSIIVLFAIAALSLGVLPVLASPSSSTISGCVNATTGVLRIAAKCTGKERVLQWNSVGPKGDSGAPTKQYKYELPGRDLPMSSLVNAKGYQRDVLLAVDTSKLPAGAYSIGVYLYGSFATASVTSNHENVWCYLQLKSSYDLADFASNKSGTFLEGDDWYDQDYFEDFVLHLSSAEVLDANYGVIYLVCRHNVALTGVYGFVVAHRFDGAASLPLAGAPLT